MRRGDVYWIALDPVRGREANKVRPAVIVSNDAANRTVERAGRGVLTVVPVTSNTDHIFPFQVLLPGTACGLDTDSKAQAEQVHTVTVERLRGRTGAVPTDILRSLDNALRLHLAL